MKKFNIILMLALLLPVALNAKKVYESEKVVNHSFPASSNHTLIVDNKYGAVDIKVWDKNEVSATITITGMSSRSQEIADELVKRVKINADASGNNITLRTEISSNISMSGSGTQGNEINYEIKVPRNIAFNLTNKYGDIKIDECGNSTTIDLKYGNLYCTKMTSKNSNLTLGYGNANVQDVNDLAADIKYANITLGTTNTLKLTTKYSDLKLNTVNNLTATSGYDNYVLNEVTNANIDAKYTSVKIGKISQSLDITNKYGSVKIDNIDKQVKTLNFNLGYTDVKINIPISVSYEFDITNKYGSIILPKNITTNIKNREQSGSTTSLKGTAGSGSTTLKVKAINSYSDISIAAK